MIENIKRFDSKLKCPGFFQGESLRQHDVKVLDSRTVKRPPRGCAHLTQGRQTEEGSVEFGSAVARIGIQFEGTSGAVRRVNTVVVNSVWNRAQQGCVVVIVEGYRKAAAESRDSRQ